MSERPKVTYLDRVDVNVDRHRHEGHPDYTEDCERLAQIEEYACRAVAENAFSFHVPITVYASAKAGVPVLTCSHITGSMYEGAPSMLQLQFLTPQGIRPVFEMRFIEYPLADGRGCVALTEMQRYTDEHKRYVTKHLSHHFTLREENEERWKQYQQESVWLDKLKHETGLDVSQIGVTTLIALAQAKGISAMSIVPFDRQHYVQMRRRHGYLGVPNIYDTTAEHFDFEHRGSWVLDSGNSPLVVQPETLARYPYMRIIGSIALTNFIQARADSIEKNGSPVFD